MQTLSADELLDRDNRAWEELKELLDNGQNTYEYVSARPEDGADTLYRLQVSTKSYLGAVAYETEGMVFDHGWITLLGAGGESVFGSLTSWNGVSDKPCVQALEGMMVVAYDVAGGFLRWIPASSVALEKYIIMRRMLRNGKRRSLFIRNF